MLNFKSFYNTKNDGLITYKKISELSTIEGVIKFFQEESEFNMVLLII